MNWYNTHKKNKKKNAAGILFLCSGKILLGLRSQSVSNSGTWAVPGGKVSKMDANYWETASRETIEELGFMPNDYSKKSVLKNKNSSGRTFTTFVLEVSEDFIEQSQNDFVKNDEFDEIQWFSLDDLPDNMHRKTLLVINKLRSTHD